MVMFIEDKSKSDKQYRDVFGDPLPESHPKILDSFRHFRLIINEDFKKECGNEIPIIPLTRNCQSKDLKTYANEKSAIKNGEFLTYKRFDSRGYSQYIFSTEDNVEIVLGEAFINRKFLFPVNKR